MGKFVVYLGRKVVCCEKMYIVPYCNTRLVIIKGLKLTALYTKIGDRLTSGGSMSIYDCLNLEFLIALLNLKNE